MSIFVISKEKLVFSNLCGGKKEVMSQECIGIDLLAIFSHRFGQNRL